MGNYLLTPRAEEDLKEIWYYTEDRYGEEQAEKYVSAFHHMFTRVRSSKKLFPGSSRPLKVVLVGKHYAFFQELDDTAFIYAVLHGASFDLIMEFLQ
jgi:toxin ParE1/3/4